jgi:hypothetical protein
MMDVEKQIHSGWRVARPEFDNLGLPSDVTALSSEQLGEKFTQLTAWADYAASELAHAILAERESQRKLNYKENVLLVSKMGSQARGERVTLIKAQIAIDPEVLGLSQTFEDKYAYRKLVEMTLHNYERDLSLISREVTRRSNDLRSTRTNWSV